MISPRTTARRACAALAVGSAGLHAVMVGHAGSVVATGLMALMIAACLYCGLELWHGGSDRAWVVVALMNLAMVAVHLPAPVHHHGVATGGVAPQSSVMAVATVLALVEALAAAVVLTVHTRGRAAELSGTRDRTGVGPAQRGRQAPAQAR